MYADEVDSSALLVVSYNLREKSRVYERTLIKVQGQQGSRSCRRVGWDAGRVQRSRSMLMAPACRSLRSPKPLG